MVPVMVVATLTTRELQRCTRNIPVKDELHILNTSCLYYGALINEHYI